MLYYTRTGETIVVPDHVCALAGPELAHEQMQRHLDCRIDLCAWKWVAYTTLVHHGRIVPSASSPLERAARRGLTVPSRASNREAAGAPLPMHLNSSWVSDIAEPQPFQEILDGLDRLVRDLRENGDPQ
jgi:hypothetical protein